MTAWYAGYTKDRGTDVGKKYMGTYFSYGRISYFVKNIMCLDTAVFVPGFSYDPKTIKAKLSADMHESVPMLVILAKDQAQTTFLFFLKDLADRAVEPVIKNVPVDQYVYDRSFGEGNLARNKIQVLQLNSLDELVFTFPPMGYVQLEQGPVFITRVPRRQYRKGICGDSLEIRHNDIFAMLLRKIGLAAPNKEADVVQNMMFPVYKSAQEAVKLLEQGTSYAIAVNKNICLSFVPNKKYLGILYKELYAGNLKEALNCWEINIFPEASPFKEELLSVLGGLTE